MKNATITRLVLVLEIAAIIFFHVLKSNPAVADQIVKDLKQSNPTSLQQSSQLIITAK